MKAHARPVPAAALAVLLVLGSAPSFACGYCVEDRIAAVYDHALLQRSVASGHPVLFFAWDGPVTRNEASRQKIMALVSAVAGVDKDSARVSVEPAALALAFDPQQSNAAAVQAALLKKLASLKISVVRLQAPGTS
jgi:hypothetical protein